MRSWDKRAWWAIGIFGAVILLDQWVKLYIKTTFHYGEAVEVIPNWLHIQFVENPGMAFGWMLPGQSGKLILTVFRILVFFGITWYLIQLIKQKAKVGLVACMALILAGAGSGKTRVLTTRQWSSDGYAPWLMGNVVDMIHVTKYIHFPEWVPGIGGEVKPLFPPIFNIADSAICVGIVVLLLFQRRLLGKEEGIA